MKINDALNYKLHLVMYFSIFAHSIIAIAIFIDLLRLYILIFAFASLKRIPIFIDGLTTSKSILIHWKIDEFFLLFGHFVSPVLIVVLLLFPSKFKKRLYFCILLLFLIEIYFRIIDSYSYIMFD